MVCVEKLLGFTTGSLCPVLFFLRKIEGYSVFWAHLSSRVGMQLANSSVGTVQVLQDSQT